MNYKKIYNLIIEHRRNNKSTLEYSETHHIIPRSLGGNDSLENLVELSAREHYICHLLLTKIYNEGTPEWCKMIKAFAYMSWSNSRYQSRYVNSRFYEYLKINFSKVQSISQSGINNNQYGKRWIYNPSLRESKRIDVNQQTPDGWFNGRVTNFNLWNENQKKKQLKKEVLKEKEQEKINKLKHIMYYYRDNDISMRALSKKFNVGHNVYKTFEKYFKNEYFEIVKKKPNNSNTTKGRYKVL